MAFALIEILGVGMTLEVGIHESLNPYFQD